MEKYKRTAGILLSLIAALLAAVACGFQILSKEDSFISFVVLIPGVALVACSFVLLFKSDFSSKAMLQTSAIITVILIGTSTLFLFAKAPEHRLACALMALVSLQGSLALWYSAKELGRKEKELSSR